MYPSGVSLMGMMGYHGMSRAAKKDLASFSILNMIYKLIIVN